MMANLLGVLEDYLSHVTINNRLDKFNMCAEIYDILLKSSNAIKGFAFFMSNADRIDSDHTKDVELKYTEADMDRLKNQLGDMVDAVFEKILKSNLSEERFYSELWRALTQSYIFDSTESIVFAIYYIVIDSRIPYFYVPDEKEMSDAKFKDLTKKNRKDIDKLRYIITSNQFNQWTTQASALLRVLDTKENDDRVVLMAHILKLMDISKRTHQIANADIPASLRQIIRQKLAGN